MTFKRRNAKRDYETTNIIAIVADRRPEWLHADFVETNDPNALDGLTQIDLMTQDGITIRRFGHL